MACKGATKKRTVIVTASNNSSENIEATKRTKILFGVDSKIQTDDLLQNNITEFEWVVRNKLYPKFWGRNLTGENCLTKEEIEFFDKLNEDENNYENDIEQCCAMIVSSYKVEVKYGK